MCVCVGTRVPPILYLTAHNGCNALLQGTVDKESPSMQLLHQWPGLERNKLEVGIWRQLSNKEKHD